MKWTGLFVASLILVGCSHANKKNDLAMAAEPQAKTLASFESANKLLDEGRAAEAAHAYDAIALSHPTSALNVVLYYNAGIAYFQNKECEVAAQRFRKAIRLANKTQPEIKARALLYMSEVYSCLGNDDKSITTLIDIYKTKAKLPDEKILAEIPARLAAAYARIGSGKEAAKYFKAAERGLLRIQSQYSDKTKRNEILSATLYAMGNLNQVDPHTMSSDNYFVTLRVLQKYLYKVVEYNNKKWAPLAAKQIEEAYDTVWDYIDRAKLGDNPDREIALREQQKQQLEIAQQALHSLRRIYAEHIPDPAEPEGVSSFLTRLKSRELKLTNFIATHILGSSLTAEALEAESVKRAGRVLNPDPILEERSLHKEKK